MTLPDTYYVRTATSEPARPALDARIDTDACIVGGGLAGLSTALELARRGRRVCLLESERIAWGASGRNGGFVSPGYATDQSHIAQRAGPGAARSLHRLSIEGAAAVGENIERLAIRAANRTGGILSVARYEASAALQSRRDLLEREFGYALEFKSRAEVQELLRSRRYYQALYDPNGFHMHPLEYARALAREIERLGGRIFEGSGARRIDTDAPGARVVTAGGAVRCRDLVVACGGYTRALLPALDRSYLPIATYVMLTRADPELIGSAIRTTAAIGDQRRASDYYRLVEGGRRILWGGRITTRVSEPARLAALLHGSMRSTFPQLAGLDVELAWSGLMAYARHLMPQIGQLRPGVWYCTAFGGHGLNTTAIAGRVVAEGISGESDRYRLFAPFGLEWTGGVAGRVAAQTTYWIMQARDFLRERRAG